MTASTYPSANIGAVARDGKHLMLVSTADRNPFQDSDTDGLDDVAFISGQRRRRRRTTLTLQGNMAKPFGLVAERSKACHARPIIGKAGTTP
jgi:hypothetical protein